MTVLALDQLELERFPQGLTGNQSLLFPAAMEQVLFLLGQPY